MKAKILKGIEHRLDSLKKQLPIAKQLKSEYLIDDTQARIDELESLEGWIVNLGDDDEYVE